jgi:hypothetical protein
MPQVTIKTMSKRTVVTKLSQKALVSEFGFARLKGCGLQSEGQAHVQYNSSSRTII